MGAEDGQITLEAAGVSFCLTSQLNQLGSVISVTGEADDAIGLNLAKVKRFLIPMHPFLRQRSLQAPLRAELKKKMMALSATYRLSTIELRIKDYDLPLALGTTASHRVIKLRSCKG